MDYSCFDFNNELDLVLLKEDVLFLRFDYRFLSIQIKNKTYVDNKIIKNVQETVNQLKSDFRTALLIIQGFV